MFSKYQDDKTRQWNLVVDRYIALHKYVREIGKTAIAEGRSGHVSDDVQRRIGQGIKQLDNALNQLKEFFKPCLTDIDTTEIFPEKPQDEIEKLQMELAKLQSENDYLRQQLNEQYKLQDEVSEAALGDLQNKEQVFERNREQSQQVKEELQKKVVQLTPEMQHLRSSVSSKTDGPLQQVPPQDTMSQLGHVKKQQQLEETLKTQNELIYDMQRRLSSSARDLQIFRNLNRNLGMELHKKNGYDDIYSRRLSELQNGNDYDDDYFHRSTLKVRGNIPPNKNDREDNQEFVQPHQENLYYERELRNYKPKFHSLDKFPEYSTEEDDYVKSKSYNFTEKNYGNRYFDNGRYPEEQLHKIVEDEKVTQEENNLEENVNLQSVKN